MNKLGGEITTGDCSLFWTCEHVFSRVLLDLVVLLGRYRKPMNKLGGEITTGATKLLSFLDL